MIFTHNEIPKFNSLDNFLEFVKRMNIFLHPHISYAFLVQGTREIQYFSALTL
jgi:hypothetical protein